MRSGQHPFRRVMTLREAMDRLLEDNFVQPIRQAVDAGFRDSFPVDLVDLGSHLELRAALPGVMPEDLQVQVQGDTLTLRATVKPHEPDVTQKESARWLMRELRAGTHERRIQLPRDLAADQAEALLENGMLTVKLPKSTPVGPRKIEVTRPTARQNPSVLDPTKPEVAPGAMAASEPSMANAADRPQRDAVTRESEESFPASDPPSWTPERA